MHNAGVGIVVAGVNNWERVAEVIQKSVSISATTVLTYQQ
jgi:hypothetical protein